MTDQKKFEKILQISKGTHTLMSILKVLEWDQETCMPQSAAHFRAEQLEKLSGLIHKERVSKKFANALAKLIDLKSGNIETPNLSKEQQRALKEWRRDYLIDKALPTKFVEKFTYLTSNAMMAWKEARHEKKFKRFAPYLKKIVESLKKKADLIGFQEHPYDALVDLYEPGMTTGDISKIFAELKTVNLSLFKKVMASPEVNDSILIGDYPEEKQLQLSRKLLQDMGYTNGRLDLATHPFSSSPHPTDSRVTTRLMRNNILSCISTVLHEGGHSLYEMGLPVDQFGSPLGEAISLGIHESQSRLWETRIGLSLPFWDHYLPIVKQLFPGQLENISLEQFYKAINKVEPSYIRVEADEITYPLHVILRFELEKDIIEGKLKVDEVPEAWNEKMQTFLGITPPDLSQGCLQDIHWSIGVFGYFPTYALGNLYAAEFFEVFEKSYPDWKKRVAQGELLFIRDWLHEKIHRHGKKWRSLELIEEITGKPFSVNAYKEYLTKKYKALL